MAKQTATIQQMSTQLTPALQQGLDALPSRLAQAQGVQTGMLNAVTGAITSQLVPAEAPALQISDAVQTAIEEALTPAAQTMFGLVDQAMTMIAGVLAPLAADYAANQPKSSKRCRAKPATPGATGPGLGPPPIPPPLGCYWLMPPPGQGQPDMLTCQNPYPADPYGYGPPVRQPSPPPLGTTTAPVSNQVIYTVYVNCDASLLAGVPNLTGAIDRQLKAEGWRQVFPPGTIEASSPEGAAQMLNSLAVAVSKMCPVPTATTAV